MPATMTYEELLEHIEVLERWTLDQAETARLAQSGFNTPWLKMIAESKQEAYSQCHTRIVLLKQLITKMGTQ